MTEQQLIAHLASIGLSDAVVTTENDGEYHTVSVSANTGATSAAGINREVSFKVHRNVGEFTVEDAYQKAADRAASFVA